MMSIRPTQNTGMVMPSRLAPRMSWSAIPSRRPAAQFASGIDAAMLTTRPPATSQRLGSSRSPISVVTGWRDLNE